MALETITEGLEGDPRAEAIRKALANGADSVQDVINQSGLTRTNIYKIASQAGVDLPERIYACAPQIDNLIGKGKNLREMEKAMTYKGRWSYETIRKYINDSGQYERWMRNKKRAKTLARNQRQRWLSTLGNLVYVLKETLFESAKKEGWAYQKTIEYLNLHESSTYEPANIVELFRRYESMKKSGNKASLKELGEGLDLPAPSVGNILSEVGLEPLYGSLERHVLTEEVKLAIERGAALPMPRKDIAYFVNLLFHSNVSSSVVGKRLLKLENRPKYRVFIILTGRKQLNFANASQIYEATDAGFSSDEIVQLTGSNRKIVDYALDKRSSIQPLIVNALNVLDPYRRFERPYIAETKQ